MIPLFALNHQFAHGKSRERAKVAQGNIANRVAQMKKQSVTKNRNVRGTYGRKTRIMKRTHAGCERYVNFDDEDFTRRPILHLQRRCIPPPMAFLCHRIEFLHLAGCLERWKSRCVPIANARGRVRVCARFLSRTQRPRSVSVDTHACTSISNYRELTSWSLPWQEFGPKPVHACGTCPF